MVVADFLETFSTFLQELLQTQTFVSVKQLLAGRSGGGGAAPRRTPVTDGLASGSTRTVQAIQELPQLPGRSLTEIIWSFWQCWDRSRIPLTKSLLAPTYAFPASIIPLQSFTSWGGDRRPFRGDQTCDASPRDQQRRT